MPFPVLLSSVFALIASLNEAGLLYTFQDFNGTMEKVPVFERGWQKAMLSTESTWAQGVFSRAFGGNVETLLAVPLFVLMGIALERSNIAEDPAHHYGQTIRFNFPAGWRLPWFWWVHCWLLPPALWVQPSSPWG